MDGLRFVIYDKDDNFERELSGLDATADLVPNAVSSASFVLDDDHEALPAATAEGARCAVWFRGDERFRGFVESTPGEGPEGTVTINVADDTAVLWYVHGRQVPGAALDAQASEYRVYTGNSESVFKAALAENFARLGMSWSVAPSLNRGTPKRVEFRMHPLADKLIPILDLDDLIIVLSYDDTGAVTVDVREPETVPGVLTLDTGIPDSYSFDRVAPTVTRVVVGGRGEGVERQFIEVIDTAREAEWGFIREGYVDARNTEDGADLTIDAYQALAEGAGRVGVSTELVETERLMYGDTYTEGDRMHVQVGPVDTTQRISVSVTESTENGVEVTPRIGALDDSADVEVQIAQQLARLAAGIRDQGRR